MVRQDVVVWLAMSLNSTVSGLTVGAVSLFVGLL